MTCDMATQRALNRKLERNRNGDVIRREKPIEPDIRKVGTCWRCLKGVFAGVGQIVTTNEHKACRKAGTLPPRPIRDMKPVGV